MEKKSVPACDSTDSLNSAIKGVRGIKTRPVPRVVPRLREGMAWQKRKSVVEEKGARIVEGMGCRREPVC